MNTQCCPAGRIPVQKKARARVALLTGGGDKHYALGLAFALLDAGETLEFVGSDDLEVPDLSGHPRVRFHNLRGDQDPGAGLLQKMVRVLRYYGRLLRFAAASEAVVFHILWNNKFEAVDRTLLMIYYRLLGKRVVMTVHNVNKAARDACDSRFNRWTLRFQYQACAHLFVHTERMKQELQDAFGVPPERIRVIPYGINNMVPETEMPYEKARRRIGLADGEKAILFYGNIAPYKGLEYLVEAIILLRPRHPEYRLVIAGRPKGPASYWGGIQERIRQTGIDAATIQRIEYISDEDTEVYFKAADVLVLPYTQIFQSGVLFLGYNFGLPAIAADVGSLREEILEGETGLVCRPEDPEDLARALEKYFDGALYGKLAERRNSIRRFAEEKHSWASVCRITEGVYEEVLESR